MGFHQPQEFNSLTEVQGILQRRVSEKLKKKRSCDTAAGGSSHPAVLSGLSLLKLTRKINCRIKVTNVAHLGSQQLIMKSWQRGQEWSPRKCCSDVLLL